MSKVVSVYSEEIVFDTGHRLHSDHQSDCCEHHWLSMNDLTILDFEGLHFDLSRDDFFERVEDYGIRMISTDGRVVPIPGYGRNNGYYGTDLTLVVDDADGKTIHSIDISECQDIKE